ncbi:putative MFS transporter [Xylariaceae sp. FL0662B]|nr:putative MFS transporter [Xylariaceae sp. FL0662B]
MAESESTIIGISERKPESAESYIVDWDGPDDPSNPRNWKMPFRMMHVALVSIFVLCSNLAATMFAPGATLLAQDFQIKNWTLQTFTVSIYVLGFAVGPLALAPMSELYGRLPCYHLANLIYFAFTIGCAVSSNTAMFMVFRFIAGCMASVPMTIGGGTIADLMPSENRGKAMAMFGVGPLLGPVVGPIVGGFMVQSIGWRWTFWLISIISGVTAVIAVIFMRETNGDVLLSRKAAQMRRETGAPYKSRTDKGLTPRQLLNSGLVRPTKILIFSPMTLLLSLYTAFIFGLIFLLFATFPVVFEETYGFSPGLSGLAYLGLGVGTLIGLFTFGMLSDKLMHPKGDQTVSRPERRLLLAIFFSPLCTIGIFWYGWAAQERVHWIVPILGTAFIGPGSFLIMMPVQTYLVDVFGTRGAASALAANTIVRTLFGAFFPLVAPSLYDNLGLGWGNSLLGFICLAFIPIPLLFYKFGERLRKRFPVNL